MRAALHTFVDRKFSPGGAYDPNVPGPWQHSREVKRSVRPYSAQLMTCMGETAQYTYDTYGKFPATIPTIVLVGFVQAQHLDTEYYDAHFAPGAYLSTRTPATCGPGMATGRDEGRLQCSANRFGKR